LRLNAAGVEQVVDQRLETVSLLLDDLQAASGGLGIPPGIGARQRLCVAFDQGDRRLQFVADDRGEGGLHLFFFAESA
jgi:hypothetical protein